MKYKILLNGTNKTVMNDFFSHSNEFLDCMTSSMRLDDIMHHIEYLDMDAFCYCAANDSEEYISQLASVKEELETRNIPFIFIGSGRARLRYESGGAIGENDLVLIRPIRFYQIEDSIFSFLEEIRLAEEERLEEERRRAEEEKRHLAEAEKRRADVEDARVAREEELQRRRHILVIDDDTVMLKAIMEQIQMKYDVGLAINGKVAMNFLEKRKTDLILLDYEMPSEKGPSILERIRENEATKDIPVIFMTKVKEKEKIMQLLPLNPQGYLVKPIDNKKLMSLISKVLYGGEEE